MADTVEKPKEPTSTPDTEVSEVQTADDGSSKEAGPDAAELVEKLKSMESELGRFKQELGDERKKSEELNAYKLWYDQNALRQQQVPQQQQQKPNYDEQWFDKPTETLEQLVSQREARLMYQSAYQQAPMAKTIARMQNPDAFDGITDAELDQAMYGGVQSGTTNPAILSDPNAWIGAAWILKGPKTGFKMPTVPPAGLSTTPNETPSGGSPPSEEDEIPPLEGDDLTAAFIENARRHGITKEQLEKRVHEKRLREGR